MEIVAVTTKEHIEHLCALAEEIWHETYDPILPQGQTEYMLEKYQSPKAVAGQIKEQGYRYFLLQQDTAVGFVGIVPNCENPGELLLSKVYLLSRCRGQGLIRTAFAFVEAFARENKLKKIWLTVNKDNSHAQDVYRHFGFETVKSVKNDIGNGYFMDDYIMMRALS